MSDLGLQKMIGQKGRSWGGGGVYRIIASGGVELIHGIIFLKYNIQGVDCIFSGAFFLASSLFILFYALWWNYDQTTELNQILEVYSGLLSIFLPTKMKFLEGVLLFFPLVVSS